MPKKPYVSPDFAFDVFQSLRFNSAAPAASWENAVESLTQHTVEVFGNYPNYEVRDGDLYYRVTIYCADYFTCPCLEPAEVCKHIAAVALVEFLPLAQAHVRRWRIEGGTQPLASWCERLAHGLRHPPKGWRAGLRALRQFLHKKFWTKHYRPV